MVLVCLGTQDMPFNRLVSMVEDCIDSGVINDRVVIQLGATAYNGDKMESFSYCSSEEMQRLMQEADLIITHAGTGTIVSALKLKKKVIAINRLAKYKEHTNDHQEQIIKEFYDTGFILACFENDDLKQVIKASQTFEVKPFISNTHNILAFLEAYIDENI